MLYFFILIFMQTFTVEDEIIFLCTFKHLGFFKLRLLENLHKLIENFVLVSVILQKFLIVQLLYILAYVREIFFYYLVLIASDFIKLYIY